MHEAAVSRLRRRGRAPGHAVEVEIHGGEKGPRGTGHAARVAHYVPQVFAQMGGDWGKEEGLAANEEHHEVFVVGAVGQQRAVLVTCQLHLKETGYDSLVVVGTLERGSGSIDALPDLILEDSVDKTVYGTIDGLS